ncbi:DNA adenine methylase [uncultured Helicobacter sp.]|uniref:DNA adenine methylase n=1 Tax=uncultured Helicobacter sp. TaxID=175537 RepID=UPI002637A5BB|nr:DNA adenine methylase [uncultured Helicobacter sp.]
MNFTKATTLKAPFGWIGGKSRLAKEIVEMMPEHKLYVEVFGGGLSVLYAKPKMPKISEVVNDINGELVNLHRVIKTFPVTFTSLLSELLISREMFFDFKNKRLTPKNKIERAVFFYYCLTYSFASKGDSFAMPKSRPAKKLYKDFSVWSKRLSSVCIENLSFEKLIKEYDREETLFYLDPPYMGTEDYYKNTLGFGKKEHELLAEILKGIKGKFILSYNDTPKVRELYRGFNFKGVSTLYTLNIKAQRRVGEVIICNFG